MQVVKHLELLSLVVRFHDSLDVNTISDTSILVLLCRTVIRRPLAYDARPLKHLLEGILVLSGDASAVAFVVLLRGLLFLEFRLLGLLLGYKGIPETFGLTRTSLLVLEDLLHGHFAILLIELAFLDVDIA